VQRGRVVIVLALSARVVAIGRPYSYGLAVSGQAGIEHVLCCMLAELDLIMAADGYPSVTAFDRDALRRGR
jgi:lactate 2-monooxygenase